MESHPPSAPSPAATHGSFSIHDVLNLPSSIDLLDDDFDIESTMMMLDTPSSPSMMSPHSMNPYRRESSDNMELNAASIADSFTTHDTDSPAPVVPSSLGGGVRTSFSPGLKIRIGGRTPLGPELLATAVTSDPRVKREPVENAGSMKVAIKQEPSGAPDLSPVMDSFLRESWEDIVESGQRSARSSSFRTLPSVATPTMLSPTQGRVNPLPLSFFLPGPSSFIGSPSFSKNGQVLNASLPGPPSALRAISTASTASIASSASTASASSTSSRKAPRRAKQCVVDGCVRRAQSNNRCKTHGGGARCQMEGCDKSSQGGGLCRAHGGGKKCRIPGCTKGTQRLGLCYLHGGIRRCIMEGCKKKDRGNGYCISHGGGRRCETEGCARSVRKGNHCQMHQNCADVSPFTISRGHGLTLS